MTLLAADNTSVFRGGKTILNDVTFQAHAGEFIAVLGPNGAGKSTLLKAQAGLIKPDEGQVMLDAKSLSALSYRELAARRAYLPQNPYLEWPLPVERLVALGLTPKLPAYRTPTLIVNGDAPFTMAHLGMISLAFATIVVAMAYAIGHVSGCHINPAVTFGLAVTRKFPWSQVLPDVLAQVVGAIVGAAAIIAVLGHKASAVGLGVASYAGTVSAGQAFAAEFVDAQVAPFADKLGATAVERLVEDAIIRYMPDLARAQRETAAEGRRFDIEHDQLSFAGTSHVEGELDLADALDLEHAISELAAHLKTLGNDQPLDVRRALAAGEFARRQLALDLDTTPGGEEPNPSVDVPARVVEEHSSTTGRRDVVLCVHLSKDAVLSLEGHGNPTLTPETLTDWLDIPDHVHLTVRPVIDLAANLTSRSRFATDLQREQIALRDKTCVAPHCTRPARHLDLDHIDPWDDNGPPGQTAQTSSANLAALCRHHHRAKTFTSWTYQQLAPGVFLWETPLGLRYLTTAGHTIDLNG